MLFTDEPPLGSDRPRSSAEWSTPNLDLAAFLKLRGHSLLRADAVVGNPSQFLIVFASSAQLVEDAVAWNAGEFHDFRRYAELHNNVYRLVRTTRQLAGATS